MKTRVTLLGLLDLIEARLLRDVLALSRFGGSSGTSALRGVLSLEMKISIDVLVRAIVL